MDQDTIMQNCCINREQKAQRVLSNYLAETGEAWADRWYYTTQIKGMGRQPWTPSVPWELLSSIWGLQLHRSASGARRPRCKSLHTCLEIEYPVNKQRCDGKADNNLSKIRLDYFNVWLNRSAIPSLCLFSFSNYLNISWESKQCIAY